MPETPADFPLRSICGAITADGTPCKRKVMAGSGSCAYHAKTLKQKLRAWARNDTLLFGLTVLGIVIGVIALGGWAYDEFIKKPRLPTAAIPSPVPPPSPVSLQLGCEWSHIPIHIQTASSIHVMRLLPAILNGSPSIPEIGVFEVLSSTSNEALDWPSKSDGRSMTKSEFQSAIGRAKGMPNPYAFNCTLSNFGAATLDKIVAELIIDTSDEKRHSYPVAFEPLMSGRSYSFYLVNVCSYGVTPMVVQWGESATVRALGDEEDRSVPLKFERTNWPGSLAPIFGPSSFLWNGVQSCQWDGAN
jgi:hypothetical protein